MNSIASTPMFLFNIVIVLGSYAGYRAYELLCEPPEPSRSIPEPDHDASPPAQETSPARRDTSGTVSVNNQRNLGVGLAAMSISATRWIGLSIPFAAPASLALTVVATLPILRRAERSLTSRRVDNDLLTSMVSVTTIGLGQFVAAGLQATSYHFGQFMAEWSKASAQKSVLDVIDPPGAVWRRVGESVVSTPLEDLNAGDIVVVEAGEVIPVDGTVVRGNASVDERVLTGESVPADKEVGDRLLASTLVVSGTVELEVSRTGSETAAARIAALLERTQHYKSEQQLRAERWSDGAALPVLLTSAVITPFRGLSSAASIMFAVPSNAIRSTGSMQTAGHLTAATRRGILVCDGRGLEALARVDTVLFDKTGTLTEDGLHFESVVSTGRQDPDLVLAWAAALDQRISHPIARSLVDHAEQQGLELPAVEDLSVAMGGGVQGRIDGHDVLFGSRRFIERHDIDVEAQYDPREPPDAPCTEVFLASDGQLHGVISLRPRVRPEARRVVGQLRAAGIQTLAVVSGDTPAPTEFVAGQLGLDRWYAETLPEQKADLVAQLQAEGRSVCFIGDGINDALAMNQADAAISLAGAAPLAMETAQLVLLDGDLGQLPEAFTVSRDLHRRLSVTLGAWGAYGLVAVARAIVSNGSILGSTAFYGAMMAGSGLYSAWPVLTAPRRSPARHGPAPGGPPEPAVAPA